MVECRPNHKAPSVSREPADIGDAGFAEIESRNREASSLKWNS
jgi:hypothetical protein